MTKTARNLLLIYSSDLLNSGFCSTEHMIDLRSDTVTKPTPAMRRAMAEAEVGDDVYGEDPTVNRLQERAAEIFEKEAAHLRPDGLDGQSDCRQAAHAARHGSRHRRARPHLQLRDGGDVCHLRHARAPRPKPRRQREFSTGTEIEAAIHTGGAYYVAPTGLIALENSHNLAGGHCLRVHAQKRFASSAHAR